MSETLAEGAADEAAHWFAKLRSDACSPGDRSRFLEWLRSEENSRAYARCSAVWDETGEAAFDGAILTMRREALAMGQRRYGRWTAALTAIAAAIVLVALVAGPGLFERVAPDMSEELAPMLASTVTSTYRTDVGQSSTAVLADGSRVELNTDTELHVNFEQGVRRIALVRGQALFDVAHDETRPFVVEARDRTITALGTVFDVNLAGDRLSVTLVEGRIAIAEQENEVGSARAEPSILLPGQQLVAGRSHEVEIRPAAVERVTSWRSGRVVFEDERLAEVIGEINRYSERRIVLGDPALADLRVSGVFRTGSVAGFSAALSASFPVRTIADPASNTIVVLPRAHR